MAQPLIDLRPRMGAELTGDLTGASTIRLVGAPDHEGATLSFPPEMAISPTQQALRYSRATKHDHSFGLGN